MNVAAVLIQNIRVVPEMMCEKRAWCQHGNNGGAGGDGTLRFCGISFGVGCFISVFNLSICQAPSVGAEGGAASPKVALEQLNRVPVWISLGRMLSEELSSLR